MKDTDLAWLAGFWDGEGTITLFTHSEKNGSRKIKTIVCVVNTDLGMISKARKILEELGCGFHMTERRPARRNHSTAWILQTNRQENIIKFLTAVLPYLSGEKKERGEILLNYCLKRNSMVQRFPSKGSTPYSEEDWDALDAFNKMGFKRSNNRSSTTTREETQSVNSAAVAASESMI